ncbi:ssDNA-binding protein [Plastorhodobacter daqingensis]|uniref:SsDNA-binding protein n=1 Tax=Plastorhodobacter daqingensis TaxID=1387281 RepID=A0ABW2ULL7_9RHOB
MAGKISPKDPTGRTVQLSRVRLSFAESLQEARVPKDSAPGTEPKHGANILIEKGGKYPDDFASNVQAVKQALAAACREFKRPEDWWKTLFEDSPKECAFRKGTRYKKSDGAIYDGYEEALVIAAKGPRGGREGFRPKIMDRYKRDVEVKDINAVAYNGTYADVIVSFYGTKNGGTPRISASIEAIRSHQEGDRLGGGGVEVSSDDFDDLEDDDFAGAGGSVSSSDDDLLG